MKFQMNNTMQITPRIVRVPEAEPVLTKDEALAIDGRIRHQINAISQDLYTMYAREGWRALGHESFHAYRLAAMPDIEKSQFYRLLRASEVAANIGQPVPERHARVLDELPDQLHLETYAAAGEIAKDAGEEQINGTHVRAAVDAAKATIPAEDHNEPRQVAGRVTSTTLNGSTTSTPDEQGRKREVKRDKWDRALSILRDACGVKLAKAIESDTFPNITDQDVVLWAIEEKHKTPRAKEVLLQIERLVAGGERQTVRQALQIIANCPSEKSTLSLMHNIAIAEGGVTMSTVGGAMHATLAAGAPKWAHKELAALVKKIQSHE